MKKKTQRTPRVIFLRIGFKGDGGKGIFVLKGWNGRNDGGFTWKHFTHQPRDPQIQVLFQPVVGHAMFNVFKQRQATKNADQVAHKPIKLRFVD